MTPGSSTIDKFQSSDVDIGLRRDLSSSALPQIPQIRFTRGTSYEASPVRFRYGLSGCSPPCTDLTGLPAIGGFYFQAFNGNRPVAGYDYSGGWTPPLVGLFTHWNDN